MFGRGNQCYPALPWVLQFADQEWNIIFLSLLFLLYCLERHYHNRLSALALIAPFDTTMPRGAEQAGRTAFVGNKNVNMIN